MGKKDKWLKSVAKVAAQKLLNQIKENVRKLKRTTKPRKLYMRITDDSEGHHD